MSAHKADRLPGDSAVCSCFIVPALIWWYPVWWTPRSQETTKKAVALGGEVALSEADKALLRNAAALGRQAERMQAAIVKDEDVDLAGLTRLSNCVSRALGQLSVKRERRDTTPGLAEYSAANHNDAAT